MKKAILYDIFKSKNITTMHDKYQRYHVEDFSDVRIPEVTVHGRFQSSLHINHFYTYVATGFRIAEKVNFLITNPELDEDKSDKYTLNREKPENNPFTYEERVRMIKSTLDQLGIPRKRYNFVPFKITEDEEWEKVLDLKIPNLVNTYGDWSKAKLAKFREKGFKVIHSVFPKIVDVSGTKIREILKLDCSISQKKRYLINAGHMEEAVPGLLDVISKNKLGDYLNIKCSKKTKIIATLSHRAESSEKIRDFEKVGVDIFRINLVHNNKEWNSNTVDKIRSAAPSCEVMFDLQGPAIRLGVFEGAVHLNSGDTVSLITKDQDIKDKKFFINHKYFYAVINDRKQYANLCRNHRC